MFIIRIFTQPHTNQEENRVHISVPSVWLALKASLPSKLLRYSDRTAFRMQNMLDMMEVPDTRTSGLTTTKISDLSSTVTTSSQTTGGLDGKQVWSLSGLKVSWQVLRENLNQVSSVSLLMTASTALANEGLFELTRRPSLTRAVSLSFAETTEEPGFSQVKSQNFV